MALAATPLHRSWRTLRVAVSLLPLLVGLPVQVGEQMKRMPGGTGSNPFAQMVEDADGLDKIEALQVRKQQRYVLL